MLKREEFSGGLTMEEFEKGKILYGDGEHFFIWLGWTREKEEVPSNQYLIVHRGKGILLDPGGVLTFPNSITNVSRYIKLEDIEYIFYSHQDPDVSSGFALWASACPNAKFLISKLWIRFIPHFGQEKIDMVEPLEDEGRKIFFGADFIDIIPAHFLHSEGNFSLYDSRSKILFSGDIGASMMPEGREYFEVKNFEEHIRFMEGFHKRYMKGNQVLRKWVSIVRRYNIDIIAPQHGAIFKGEQVKKFLDWLYNLKCGVDNLDEIYKR